MIAFPHKNSPGSSLARGSFALVVLCAAVLGLSLPATAQIASSVDANGRVVFVNSDPPVERKKPASKDKEVKVKPGNTSDNVAEHKNGGLATGPGGQPASEPAGHDIPRVVVANNVPEPRQVVPPERLERIVNDAAAKHDLDPALVSSVIDVESNWNQSAISRKGALGLMQLIPSTAGEMGVRDAFDPAQNIEGGTSYLRLLLDRFHGDIPKSLAAYNAGPAAVERKGAIPNIPETRDYVRKVTSDYFRRGQGKNISLMPKPRIPVRREFDSQGHVLFTND